MKDIVYLKNLLEQLTQFGIKIIIAIVIFFVGRFLAKIISKLINRVLIKRKIEATIVSFTTSLSYFAFLTFTIIAAVNQLGVQTSSFVAVIGAAGLAIGLALQGSLSNLASGFLLLILHPFKIGDYIEAAGVTGFVDKIQIFTTQLLTPDNKVIVIPNSKLTDDNIVNYTTNIIRRVDITVGTSYDDDIDKTKKVIQEILRNDKLALNKPEPIIALTELADSSLNYSIKTWVNTKDYWDFFYNINEKIKKRFDEENISIPFPQTELHLYNKDKINMEEE